ncbi:MAG: hypothetical protein B7Z55_09895, partial [Planctomycetales bacterium 12-60-4]
MNKLLAAGIVVGMVVGGAGGAFLAGRARPSEPSLSEIRRALISRQLDTAVELADRRLVVRPDDVDTRLLLGEVWQRRDDYEKAVAAYRAIPQTAEDKAFAARVATASLALQSGHLQDAEEALLLADELSPQNPLTDDQWVSVLTLSGQNEEMPAPPDNLFAKIFAVGDPLGLLGAAYTAAALGRVEQTQDLIDRCLSRRSDLVDAFVIRGMLYLDANQYEDFARFVASLPESVQQLPGYWLNCGRAAQLQGNERGAIRCYWEVLRRQPNHDRATYQMGQALATIGEREQAQRFLSRGAKLTQLQKVAIEIFDGREDAERFWECAQLTEQLGRPPECRLWCQLLLERHPTHRAARLKLQELERKWPEQPPFLLSEQDLASTFAGEKYAIPNWEASQNQPVSRFAAASQIHFVDEALTTGLDFTYFSGEDLSTPGKRMFEYTGGGVGVLDYDRDGWPDVYLTQGSHQPGDLDQSEFLDALFRNQNGSGWSSVATLARIADSGFGQGLAAADFDNDGFADLYVANIDGNRLLRNNGDGTFSRSPEFAAVARDSWSVSAAIADLNGDSHPDIYLANYLTGDDVFHRVCPDDQGVPRLTCQPLVFAAEPDQLLNSLGDGRFEDGSVGSGIDIPEGRGMGVVVGRLTQSTSLEVFVANDATANFHWIPTPSAAGQHSRLQYVDNALLLGTAVDAAGRAQASMGIAAGDAAAARAG